MKKAIYLFLAIGLAACGGSSTDNNAGENTSAASMFTYPETRKMDTVDTYFGTEVADPYRWLEDDRSEETGQWVKAQNKVTFSYLEGIPFRDKIKDRLTEIWNVPRQGAPFKGGDHYFVYKNDGMQNQDVLYIMNGPEGEPKVFLDPNTLSEDGTTSISTQSVSRDGKYFAYSISKAGSDWKEIYVIDIATGKHLDDKVEWVKFSGISWRGDGFYYSRYNAPKEGEEYSGKNKFHQIFYHQVGTPQSEDQLIYKDEKHPLRNFFAGVTEDETMLLLYGRESTSGTTLAVKYLDQPNSDFIPIISDFENDYSALDNNGRKLLVHTNKNAPKYRLVIIDPENPAPENWEDVIPEKEEVLDDIHLAGEMIIAQYMKDASDRLHVYDRQGTFIHELELPALGSVGEFHSDKGINTAFYSFNSFTFPSTIYKYDVVNNTSEQHYKPEIAGFNPEDYETKQVFYTSKDGTKIPMFIVHKKGLVLDGTNPTFLYGYGGFNISLTPRFSSTYLVLLENGGVYAQPSLRGGGEYGVEWHEAGMQLNKQNVFDDFIAAAEYLIDNKYTSSEKLAIHGRSNGGLLVGATMTQRPNLFKVALPGVGVLDMLRFHRFTIGWAWTKDYGCADSSKAHFDNLYKYSPLHNVKEGVEYPATMVTTADHDDRVVPAHSFKFIAELQAKHTGKNPVFIRISENAGHGAGKPTSMKIAENTDMWAFVFHNMGEAPYGSGVDGNEDAETVISVQHAVGH